MRTRQTVIEEAKSIIDAVKAAGRPMTDDERTKLSDLKSEIERIDEVAQKSAQDQELLKAFDGAQVPAPARRRDAPEIKSIGHHWASAVYASGLKSARDITYGATFEAPEMQRPDGVKANTDTTTTGGPSGSAGALVTVVDREFATPQRNRIMISDLIPSTEISGSAVSYPVFGQLEGNAKFHGEGAEAGKVHVPTPTMVTDALTEVSAMFAVTEDMAEDMPYMIAEINQAVNHDLLWQLESTLLNGDGENAKFKGLLNRAGIQTTTKGSDTEADAILKAINRVERGSKYAADAIVMNPEDYEKLRLSRDGNGQYYGGGFFSGPYGVGGVVEKPPVWGTRTVVTPAIASGTVLVGAFVSAKQLLRGGLRVSSTNSDGYDFGFSVIRTKIRQRIGLQVKYPAAFVKLDLNS